MIMFIRIMSLMVGFVYRVNILDYILMSLIMDSINIWIQKKKMV